jgi:RNA chaperone ProQ/FINO-like protein
MRTWTVGENRSAASFATSYKPPTARHKPQPIRAHLDDKAARRHGRLNTISRRLFKAFPRVFKYPPVPLAIAIGPKLCELMGPEFKPAEVRAFLHAWTSGPRYLKAVVRGEMRRNLDGSPAGVPEPKHRTAAKELKRSGTRARASIRGRDSGAQLLKHVNVAALRDNFPPLMGVLLQNAPEARRMRRR